MPTHEELRRFSRDWNRLTPAQQRQFLTIRPLFVEGLRNQPPQFHPSLRVKRVDAKPGVWEMSWAPDGRATFQYGSEVRPGNPHVVWRRIGTHDIFREP